MIALKDTNNRIYRPVNKELSGSQKIALPDQFYTSIINTFGTNLYNSQLDLLLYFFNNVSEVNSLVTYIAQKGADIPVKHVMKLKNGKTKDLGETDIIRLLKKPNHLTDDGRIFTVNALSSFLVFGFMPINKVVPIGWPDPAEIYLFPSNQFYPIPEKSINMYGLPASGVDYRLNKIIKYRLFIDNIPFEFAPDQIITINDSNLSFANGAYLTGQSRLYSAIRSIQSLSSICDTINTLIAGKGAEGIVVKRSRANETDSGWNPEDKKRLEDKLYSYGTTNGKRPIATSEKDLGFIRLSVPISDFMPIELKDSEFRTLASALMFPAVLLNDKDGAIYNNVSLAEKAFYTNCLQPLVNQYYDGLTNGFRLSERGEALIAIWDDIECLQGDREKEATAMKSWNEVFKTLWDNNLTTRNQWLEYIGLPRINKHEFDKLKSELSEKPIEEPNIEANEPEE